MDKNGDIFGLQGKKTVRNMSASARERMKEELKQWKEEKEKKKQVDIGGQQEQISRIQKSIKEDQKRKEIKE